MTTQTKRKSVSAKNKRKVAASRARYQVQTKRAKLTRHKMILTKCKDTLARYYGDRLKGLILYGSMARNEATPSSDIDLLVLLTPPLDYFAELRRLVDILYPIQLESEHLISAKPVSVRDFESGSSSLYRNAKREGVAV